MLIKLGISSSGYYSWKKRKPSDRKKRKAEIKEEIKGIYIGSKKKATKVVPSIISDIRKRLFRL